MGWALFLLTAALSYFGSALKLSEGAHMRPVGRERPANFRIGGRSGGARGAVVRRPVEMIWPSPITILQINLEQKGKLVHEINNLTPFGDNHFIDLWLHFTNRLMDSIQHGEGYEACDDLLFLYRLTKALEIDQELVAHFEEFLEDHSRMCRYLLLPTLPDGEYPVTPILEEPNVHAPLSQVVLVTELNGQASAQEMYALTEEALKEFKSAYETPFEIEEWLLTEPTFAEHLKKAHNEKTAYEDLFHFVRSFQNRQLLKWLRFWIAHRWATNAEKAKRKFSKVCVSRSLDLDGWFYHFVALHRGQTSRIVSFLEPEELKDALQWLSSRKGQIEFVLCGHGADYNMFLGDQELQFLPASNEFQTYLSTEDSQPFGDNRQHTGFTGEAMAQLLVLYGLPSNNLHITVASCYGGMSFCPHFGAALGELGVSAHILCWAHMKLGYSGGDFRVLVTLDRVGKDSPIYFAAAEYTFVTDPLLLQEPSLLEQPKMPSKVVVAWSKRLMNEKKWSTKFLDLGVARKKKIEVERKREQQRKLALDKEESLQNQPPSQHEGP